MYTPPAKPVIVPKAVNTDLPCATNPGQQPSKPAPIYQPPTTKPSVVAPAPVIPVPSAPQANAPYNPAPTVASLTSQLSGATLVISQASLALGFTGPARDFIAFSQNLAVELKTLRAKP